MTRSLSRSALVLGLVLALQGCASAPAPEPAEQQVIRLKYADCAELGAVLRQFAEQDTEAGPKMVVIAHAATNSLLVSGPAETLAQAKDLIARLDQPADK